MNDFEQACNEVDKSDGKDWFASHENVIEFLKNGKTATCTFCQGKYINKIKKLAENHPEDVRICKENSDGSIVAHIPTSYIRLVAPSKKQLSEEELQILRERMTRIQENQKKIRLQQKKV